MTFRPLAVLALVLALGLPGCGPRQTSTGGPPSLPPEALLEAAVDAAIAADSIARPQDAPYLAIAQACMNVAVDELASSDNRLLRSTKIGAACASAVAAGTNAPNAVQAVVTALNIFLRSVSASGAVARSYQPPGANAFAPASSARQSKPDKRRLERVRKKLQKLNTKK